MPPAIHAASTSRIHLTPLSPTTHLSDFHTIWSNPSLITHLPPTAQNSTTLEDAHTLLVSQLANEQIPGIDKFAILLRRSPTHEIDGDLNGADAVEEGLKMIGVVGTNRPSPQGLEVGYVIDPFYWGQGYASEAFACFLKLYWTLPGLFAPCALCWSDENWKLMVPERANVDRLVAKIARANGPSRSVVVKAGARRLGEYEQDEGGWTDYWVLDRGEVKGREEEEEMEKGKPV